MADGKNGSKTAEQPQMQAQVVGQFIRDLSFENPNVMRLLDGPGDNPNLKLEVNVNAERGREDLYQSAIDFKTSSRRTKSHERRISNRPCVSSSAASMN